MKYSDIKSSMEGHISHCIASKFGSRPKAYSDKNCYTYLKLQEASLNNINILDYYLKSCYSNEDYIYNSIPRCVVTPGGISIVPDQLTNPYILGKLQYESEENIYNLVAEFRRMPIKLEVELKYFTLSSGLIII